MRNTNVSDCTFGGARAREREKDRCVYSAVKRQWVYCCNKVKGERHSPEAETMACGSLGMVFKRWKWKYMCLSLCVVVFMTGVWFVTRRPLESSSAPDRIVLGNSPDLLPSERPTRPNASQGKSPDLLPERPTRQNASQKNAIADKPCSETPVSLQLAKEVCGHTTNISNLALRFLEICGDIGLRKFLLEPSLLMDIEAGIKQPCFWVKKVTGPLVTFGVIDPSEQQLKRLSEAFKTRMPFSQLIYDVDPRNVTSNSFANNKALPKIPMHLLLSSGGKDYAASLLFHLVVFRSRGDYLWHSQLAPQKFPFPVANFSIGQHAALMDRFNIQKKSIGGVSVSVPECISIFLRNLGDSKLVECNYQKASEQVNRHKNLAKPEFREKIHRILRIAVRTLDRLGVTFWLGSGTFLGWYRHCDVVPYTGDVDIEMKIKDYTPAIPKALNANGLHLIRQLGKLNDSFELTFKLGMNMDIFFLFEEKNHTWFGMFDPGSFKKYRLIFPKFALRWAEFGGLKVRIPYPPEAYLDAHYGKTWTEPNKRYHWLNSPPNRVFAGVWPVSQRKGLRNFYP